MFFVAVVLFVAGINSGIRMGCPADCEARELRVKECLGQSDEHLRVCVLGEHCGQTNVEQINFSFACAVPV